MIDQHCGSKWSAIESQARFLQLELWNSRYELWGSAAPSDPLGVLQPGVAIERMGYTIESARALEEMTLAGEAVQTVGLLDHSRRLVRISSRFSKEEQRYTAAHELGHIALKHRGELIHRDRSFSDIATSGRVPQEREADWFAACFLMPAKQLTPIFQRTFLTEKFALDDDTAFALFTKPLDAVLRHFRSVRDISLALSSALFYGGRDVVPLTQVFGVSRSAMAIRLEQLGLVTAPA